MKHLSSRDLKQAKLVAELNDLDICDPKELRDLASALGFASYPDYVIQQVADHYDECPTRADKERLAELIGIESLNQLYNLASDIKGGRYDKVLEALPLELRQELGPRARPSSLAERQYS